MAVMLRRLREIETGCLNWADVHDGEVSNEKSVADCGKRCAETEGCVGFGYQHGASPNFELGRPEAGTCALWKGPCSDEDNPYWDDYEMAATTRTTVTTIATTEKPAPVKNVTTVSMGSLTIDNIDLKTLRNDHEVYKRFYLTLQQQLAAKLGVEPDAVNLDFDDSSSSGAEQVHMK
jgi:hypothetical protein